MSYKPLTKAGKAFIMNALKLNANNFTGSLPYDLGRSNILKNTVFTAQVRDNNVNINTNDTYYALLVSSFEKYSQLYLLDANIMAAQTYLLSNYVLWNYSNGGNGVNTSAMGITQLLDSTIYDLYFEKRNGGDAEDQAIFDNEFSIITNNLAGDMRDIKNIIPYRDDSTALTNSVALENRRQLFQNIIDNPDLMIKIQCRIMHDLGYANNNLAASSLFAYIVSRNLKSKTYNEVINNASYANFNNIHIGTAFVNNIFKILDGSYQKDLGGFGYDIDFDINDQANMNLSNSIILTGNYGLSVTQEKFIQQLHPQVQDKFRALIATIEKTTPFKVRIECSYRSFQYQQTLKQSYSVNYPTIPVAEPGKSYHQYGLALDISLWPASTGVGIGTEYYSHNKTQQQWVDTTVPEIATDLGFVWGGDFTKYDPVHFDLSSVYALKSLYATAIAQFGSNPNKIAGNKIKNLQPSVGGYS